MELEFDIRPDLLPCFCSMALTVTTAAAAATAVLCLPGSSAA